LVAAVFAIVAFVGLGYTQEEGIDPALIDSDFDGCSDAEEFGSNPSLGGLRNPDDPWDVYDIAGFYGSEQSGPDGVIDALDVQLVAFRWNTQAGDAIYDSGSDRSVELVDGPYDLGPPDGQITISDLQAVMSQFGLTCLGAPVPAIPVDMEQWLTATNSQAEFEAFVQDLIEPILNAPGGPAGAGIGCVAGDGSFALPLAAPDTTTVSPEEVLIADPPESEELGVSPLPC